MADGEVEPEKPQGKERNWRDEESYLLPCMRTDLVCAWDVANDAETKWTVTKGKEAYCQIDVEITEKYDITRTITKEIEHFWDYNLWREYENILPQTSSEVIVS